MEMVLYGKPDCYLCDRLLALMEPQLKTLRRRVDVDVKKHDITTDSRWLDAYQYRIPVLTVDGQVLLEGKPNPEEIARAFAPLLTE